MVIGWGSLALVWLGGPWIAVLTLVATVAMVLELGMISRRGASPDARIWLLAIAAAVGVLVSAAYDTGSAMLALALGVIIAAAFEAGAGRKDTALLARLVFTLLPAGVMAMGLWWGSTPVTFAGAACLIALIYVLYTGADDAGPMTAILGTLYIGTATIAFIALREAEPFGFLSILWAGLVVIGADVGGYFAGRMIGGAKLWPRVSPKKTWSGLAGGVILAFFVGGVFSWATTGTYFYQVCLVSMVAALVSQGGDLAESALKRHFGVKDASGLIPGHGGVLDRLDGHLAAILVAAAVTFVRDKPVFVW